MSHLDQLEKSVSAHEGFRSVPYLDTQQLWTFAKGRCLQTNPLTAEEWTYLLRTHAITVSISLQGADWLMIRDLQMCESDCARSFEFFPLLNDARQNVLVEMVYQMGIVSVRGFTRMIAALRAQRWTEAALEGLRSKWAKIDSPERARRLMRQLESGVFA